MGRFEEVEAALSTNLHEPKTADDWVGVHIAGMANLRTRRLTEARHYIERGVQSCPFRQQREYFRVARAMLDLFENDAVSAASTFAELSRPGGLPASTRRNVVLFQAHALAESGEREKAQGLIFDQRIIDLTAERQKRLAICLNERFNLDGRQDPSPARQGELDATIREIEFRLIELPNIPQASGARLAA